MAADDIAQDVLERLELAWNTADGEAYGREYAADASFVNLNGLLVHGPAAIAAGHDQIFATIYAGSTNRMRLLSASQVADTVIVMTSRNSLHCPTGPLAGDNEAIVTAVLACNDNRWQISASQTTLVVARPALAGAR